VSVCVRVKLKHYSTEINATWNPCYTVNSKSDQMSVTFDLEL